MTKRYSEIFKNQVKEVLEKNEKARNDDVYGTLLIWNNYYKDKLFETGKGKAILLKDIMELPNMEGFKRYRARFNEVGLYRSTDETILKRRRQQKTVLNELAKINKL